MIGAQDAAAIVAVLLALLATAVALERSRAGRVLPGPAIMLLGGFGLANLGVLPQQSIVYREIADIVVPTGVFLLLLRADLRRIFRETGALLGLYLVGSFASLIGVLAAYVLVPLPDGAKIAAAQLANLVGGTVNVVAVSSALALDPSRFAAMMAAAAVVMSIYLLAMSALFANPAFQRWLPARAPTVPHEVPGADPTSPPFDSLQLVVLVAVAFGTVVICELLLRTVGRSDLLVIAVSLVAIAAANLSGDLMPSVSGDREVGCALMYMFFGTLGAGVGLGDFGRGAAGAAVFVGVAVLIHLVLLLLVARWAKASAGEVLVASIAGVGGPSSAAAMAAAFGQTALVTPGVLCGLLGLASATFLGLALFALLTI